jgi:tetratricopeptide (TPR) repeat protein
MGVLQQLAGLFSKSSRDDNVLNEALAHAKAKRPDKAIAIYNRLLDSPGTSARTRASALFNRALAYSAQDDDQKAIVDLERCLALPDLPDNVESAARSQLARVRRRNAQPNSERGGA